MDGVVKVKILRMQVCVVSLEDVVSRVLAAVMMANRKSFMICVSNVHMCMEVFDKADFCSVVNGADLVIPDGKPLSCAQNILGYKAAQQVRGQDIMSALCAASDKENLRIGFYGGSSGALLDKVRAALRASYPNINISYAYSPPFRPLTQDEDDQVVDEINNAGVDILFVGIGCPKQERWMAEHKERLSCVMLGVGAAFDFIAGEKRHAPRWIQRIGMEWLFRLCSEPTRLWRRYFNTNPRFIWFFMQQWLLDRKY